jgi:hypothetical protein
MTENQVRVVLTVDEHGAVKGMRAAGEESGRTEHKLGQLDKSVKGLGKSFGGLKNMIGMGLGAIGVGGLAMGLDSVANKTKEIATETEKFHTVTGIGTQSSLLYTQALKARGLSGEAVGKAFGFLAKNIKSAELQEQKYGTSQATAATKGKASTAVLGRQASALKELGINMASFNSLTEQGKLEKVTKSFEALAPGMKKTRLERELFGKGGNALSTVLEKNNLGLSKQIDLAKKFFPEIKGGAGAMNELLEKQAESKMAWEGLELTLGEKLIPAMTAVMGWFSKITLEVEQGKGTWGQLGSAIEGVAGVLKGVWTGFEKVVGPAKALEIAIGGLIAVKTVAGIAAFGKALSVIGFGGPFMLEVAAVLLLIKGFEKLTGDKVMKKLAEETGLLPVEKKTVQTPHRQADVESAAQAASYYGAHPSRLTPYTLGHMDSALRQQTRDTLEERHEHVPGALKRGTTPGTGGNLGDAIIHLSLDTTKVAEAIIKNPRARRLITEGTAIHAQGMAARK